MRWDDLNMGDKSRMIQLAVDSGITDLRTIRDVYNSYAEGGHLFWPGGGMSPINPKVVSHWASNTLRSLVPRKLTNAAYEAASERSGEGLAALGTAENLLTKDGRERVASLSEYEDVGRGFLLDDRRQRKYMESLGYHLVDDTNYGMVNKATRNLMDKTGKSRVPIYQLGEDDIDPSLVELVSVDPKVVSHYHLPPERQLIHANSHPMALYKDEEGNTYLKAWDLNDYGQHNSNIINRFADWITGYDKKLTNWSGSTYGSRQFLAELYDLVGNPFVQRTGLVKVDGPEKQSELEENRLKQATDALLKLYSEVSKANGGKIHTKPENQGTLFAMGGNSRRRKTLITELPEVTVTPQWLSYWEATPEQTRTLTNKNGKYNTTSLGDKGEAHFDVITARNRGLSAALDRAGFTQEEKERLTPFLLTQLVLEGGWITSRADNNFGGMKIGGGEKNIQFENEDAFYDAYLANLDKKWGDDYLGKGKGWRNAKTIDDYANIINREDLGLHTKEAWEEYNRTHRDHPAYIYTPWWRNNNNGLMSENKFGGIYDRVVGNYDLLNTRIEEWDKLARKNKIIAK